MSSVFVLLKYAALSVRLQAAVPALAPAAAHAHVVAAYEVATEQVSPELLLAIAFVESRFDPTATSRVEGRVRRTGSYPSTRPPAGLDTRASLYCGPLQTFAASWGQCLAARDLRVAYAAGVAEIQRWLGDRRVRGNVSRALAGHGCGNFGVTSGSCNGYPGRVLGMEQRFQVGSARPHVAPSRGSSRALASS